MPRAIVLGAGMVGSVVAADLAADHDVTIADHDGARLEEVSRTIGVSTAVVDLTDADAVGALVEPHDIVLGAAPSTIGLRLLRSVIEAGRPYCDISFMPEDGLDLDDLARSHGVTAIIDCGVAPGMSNMLAGHAVATLDETHDISIYVGGLPRERTWPFEYKVGFAPSDVIEEYTRPSRIVEHGSVVIREALSDPELIDFDGIGTLEAFNTDGLRSLAQTLDVPFMKEKTLRYPGHIELMRVMRAAGLFSHEPVEIDGHPVRPIDVFGALVFPQWAYEEGEEDLTAMRVTVDGVRDGQPTRMRWDLVDRYADGTTSIARTTAFPCTIFARLILAGRFAEPGVHAPERLGQAGLLGEVLAAHRERGVDYRES